LGKKRREKGKRSRERKNCPKIWGESGRKEEKTQIWERDAHISTKIAIFESENGQKKGKAVEYLGEKMPEEVKVPKYLT